MGLSSAQIKAGVDWAAAREPAIARALGIAGYPEPRIRAPGYATMLRTIVGQQVSVAAASSMWRKLEALVGEDVRARGDCWRRISMRCAPAACRARNRAMSARCANWSLAASSISRTCPAMTRKRSPSWSRIKGIGRWSAEIYLLFAEGRPDIWPAGDLAVQAGIGKILGHAERPSEKATRALADAWRPHRGAIAIFTWHCYNNSAL